jgi:hypothetical protein
MLLDGQQAARHGGAELSFEQRQQESDRTPWPECRSSDEAGSHEWNRLQHGALVKRERPALADRGEDPDRFVLGDSDGSLDRLGPITAHQPCGGTRAHGSCRVSRCRAPGGPARAWCPARPIGWVRRVPATLDQRVGVASRRNRSARSTRYVPTVESSRTSTQASVSSHSRPLAIQATCYPRASSSSLRCLSSRWSRLPSGEEPGHGKAEPLGTDRPDDPDFCR